MEAQFDVNSSSLTIHVSSATMIEDLLNCPTMASVSQPGSVWKRIFPRSWTSNTFVVQLHNTGIAKMCNVCNAYYACLIVCVTFICPWPTMTECKIVKQWRLGLWRDTSGSTGIPQWYTVVTQGYQW